MITIHLNHLKFYSYHGLQEQEKLQGNEFEVNADVQFHEEHTVISNISETIDYADIFEIIKSRMEIPTPLLETVVMEIGNAICSKFDNIRSIQVTLQKINPPIAQMEGSVGVTWHKAF